MDPLRDARFSLGSRATDAPGAPVAMTVGVATTRTSSADGFTLIEVLVAMALIGLLASGTAVLTLSATRSLGYSQLDTAAVELARGRLDQLMSLPWGYGSAQAPSARTDGVTDLSSAVPGATGSGLFSPGGSLDQNTVGFVDHADQDGRWEIDLEQLRQKAAATRMRAIIMISPNNPTGTLVTAQELWRDGAEVVSDDERVAAFRSAIQLVNLADMLALTTRA